eukprot:scaffold20552_cov161-Skeletonema_dohrnii-CCMP3373.AAC.2
MHERSMKKQASPLFAFSAVELSSNDVMFSVSVPSEKQEGNTQDLLGYLLLHATYQVFTSLSPPHSKTTFRHNIFSTERAVQTAMESFRIQNCWEM